VKGWFSGRRDSVLLSGGGRGLYRRRDFSRSRARRLRRVCNRHEGVLFATGRSGPTRVVRDARARIDAEKGDVERSVKEMEKPGAEMVESGAILG